MNERKTDSKIFTKTEHDILNKRFEGDKLDPTGIYANRVKPKLKEISEVWFKKKKQIDKLLKA